MSNNTFDSKISRYNSSNESVCSLSQVLNSTLACDEDLPQFYWSGLYINNRCEIYSIGFTVIAILSFLSNLLTIQTVICCKDIRITNLGVYLVLFSICNLCLAVFQAVWINLVFIYDKNEVPMNACFALLLLVTTLSYLCAMFSASLSMERALIQCRDNFSLFDSRRRSFFVTCFIFSLILVYTSTECISHQRSLLNIVRCDRNYTKNMRIISNVFDYVYHGGSFIVIIVTSFLTLQRLSKRRNYLLVSTIAGTNTILTTTFKMCLKHRDFYFAPLIYPLAMLPRFFFYTFVKCNNIRNNGIVAWLDVSITLLAYSANTFTFFIYIWSSKIYIMKFKERSSVGRLFIMLNNKYMRLIDYCRRLFKTY